MQPHIHAELIKAWADGAEIEFRVFDDDRLGWEPVSFPSWDTEYFYRVKPQPHKWQAVMDACKAGKVCQWRATNPDNPCHTWNDIYRHQLGELGWFTNGSYEYRIKPEPVVKYVNVYDMSLGELEVKDNWHHNKDAPKYAGALKLTFEDGKLIAAEVLK